jgi:shikimate 5-dehydrogenase
MASARLLATDGSGWRWGFQRQLPGADLSRAVLLGAGGAGSAGVVLFEW